MGVTAIGSSKKDKETLTSEDGSLDVWLALQRVHRWNRLGSRRCVVPDHGAAIPRGLSMARNSNGNSRPVRRRQRRKTTWRHEGLGRSLRTEMRSSDASSQRLSAGI